MTRDDHKKLAAILRAERDRIHELIYIRPAARISMYAAVTSIEYSIRDMLAADDGFDAERFHDAAKASRRDSE